MINLMVGRSVRGSSVGQSVGARSVNQSFKEKKNNLTSSKFAIVCNDKQSTNQMFCGK